MHVKRNWWATFRDLPAKQFVLLLACLFFLVCLYSFLFKPFLISSDSLYGFIAYKGTLRTHVFNVVEEIPAQNLNQTHLIFQSWWSPGQWLFPGSLHCLFGARLGMASLIISVFFSLTGFTGYYFVFRHFHFSVPISTGALLIIFSSSTFYYCFIMYQGGEVLEFGIFPWFLLYVIRIRKVTTASLGIVAGLFFCCFLAKITLLLYCSVVLLSQSIWLYRTNRTKDPGAFRESVWLLFVPALCLVIVEWLFLSRGPAPTLIRRLNVSAEDLFIPLSSPLTSILSVQQWIIRAEKIGFPSHLESWGRVFSNGWYFFLSAWVIWSGYLMYRQQWIDRQYRHLLGFLYTGICLFFIISYAFDTNISYSSRHFKLLGFLCIPGLASLWKPSFSNRAGKVLIWMAALLALSDIYYLKAKWTRNRYIGVNYFYRNEDKLTGMDRLDETSYTKLVQIDRTMAAAGKDSAIFFIEANPDLSMDMLHPCILLPESSEVLQIRYYGKGPRIIACISKKTLASYPALLKIKFPEYDRFTVLAETQTHYFFKSIMDR